LAQQVHQSQLPRWVKKIAIQLIKKLYMIENRAISLSQEEQSEVIRMRNEYKEREED
jgi:hypothetical protein